MTTTDTCAICAEEDRTLYQCCPKKDDSLCEACWTKLIETKITTGKIGPVFTGDLQCEICHQSIERERLPEAIQTRLTGILSTIPKTKTPTAIEDFNYAYNSSGELHRRDTDEKFIFLSQRHYNLLGACIDQYIQSIMKTDPWNYRELWLPLRDDEGDDHHDQVNIFTSEDFSSNEEGCLILIQGSGVVRPGQWARSCCINESLDIGSMFPYMNKAKEHHLSVIILNPNQTSYVDKQSCDSQDENGQNDDLTSFYLSSIPLPRPSTKKISNLSTNREHVLYVYDQIISKCPAKTFYIVAHSAGGDSTMYLLRKRQEQLHGRLSKIAFTDSVHSVLPLESKEIRNFLKANAIHFVASDEPMGKAIDSTYHFSKEAACEEVSAGHPKHEYTSGHCVEGVFEFFFPIEKTKL